MNVLPSRGAQGHAWRRGLARPAWLAAWGLLWLVLAVGAARGERVPAERPEEQEQRSSGKMPAELKDTAVSVGLMAGALVLVYGAAMMVLLRHQARLAQETARAKSRFLAMMSHELRTPLDTVIKLAETLKDDSGTEGKKKECADGILASATALRDLLGDILDLSKLEAGLARMRGGTCNPAALAGELPAIFGCRLAESGVRLEVRRVGEAEVPELVLSGQGLRQVLVNLVGNAVKFTDSGEIAVEYGWNPQRRALRLEVRDTGRGIPKEKLARLWVPFSQDREPGMPEGGDGKERGIGLGLPLVKRLVDEAGGTISVESREGRGTKFVLEFPDLQVAGEESDGRPMPGGGRPAGDEEPAVAVPAPPEPPARPAAVPGHVLVVDDMSMTRTAIGNHLENLGVREVRQAGNGAEALDAMRNWTPDMVFTDIWMPIMDGQELAEAMRKDARLAGVPVVAVTADEAAWETFRKNVFAAVMAKPVTEEKLEEVFGTAGRAR